MRFIPASFTATASCCLSLMQVVSGNGGRLAYAGIITIGLCHGARRRFARRSSNSLFRAAGRRMMTASRSFRSSKISWKSRLILFPGRAGKTRERFARLCRRAVRNEVSEIWGKKPVTGVMISVIEDE